MFSKEQIQILNEELNSNRIKTREKGNINLSYIEGFDVIDTANKVFGFGNWSYSISKDVEINKGLWEIAERIANIKDDSYESPLIAA